MGDLTRTQRRYERQREAGRAAVRGWIGHPAVAREVGLAVPRLGELAAPLFVLAKPLGMADQVFITLATIHLLDAAVVSPDGDWPNPFEGAPRELLRAGQRIGPVLVDELRQMASRLEAAGVRLDPRDEGVLVVLAQLVLLDVDVNTAPADLVDGLNTLPPGSIDRKAAARGWVETRSSRHATVRTRVDLDAFAAAMAKGSGLSPIRGPYAGGRRRQPPEATKRLRQALATLIAQYPTLTPRELLALDQGHDHVAFERLREMLGWGPTEVPDHRTIVRNWPKSRH